MVGDQTAVAGHTHAQTTGHLTCVRTCTCQHHKGTDLFACTVPVRCSTVVPSIVLSKYSLLLVISPFSFCMSARSKKRPFSGPPLTLTLTLKPKTHRQAHGHSVRRMRLARAPIRRFTYRQDGDLQAPETQRSHQRIKVDFNPNGLDVGILNPAAASEVGRPTTSTSNRPDFGSSGWPFGSFWAGVTIESLTHHF